MKRKMIALIMSALCMAAAIPSVSVFADGEKVVTLGADLSEDQKQAILRYFGVAGQSIKTLTITNQDERNHLGSYVPLEQIGTHTYSCALVSPTNSGGIQVKTANLSWVTSNMIATTLSTSGVVNCDVLAASPFEVSGTGALTGILMAYETAVGESLDETKKEIATQEMITTTNIANNIGQVQATEIVNETKIQVIQNTENVTENDIDIIINEVADENNITLSDEDRELLRQLLEEIAQQDYDYEEMKATLERVEENMSELSGQIEGTATVETEAQDTVETEAAAETEALAEDSILVNTDDSALGENVSFDATDTSALPETEAQPETSPESSDGIDITTSDSYTDGTGETEAQTETSTIDGAIVIDGETEAPVTDGTGETEAPAADGSGEIVNTEDGAEATLNLEIIPLSDFVCVPKTADDTNYQVYAAGLNELTVNFQREDIIPGSGTLTVYDAADSSEYEMVSMSDTTKVSVKALDAAELGELGWSNGYKAVISLTKPLAQSSTYFVILSQDAFSTADGIGSSEAIADSSTWMIQTSQYGFYLDKSMGTYTAGSSVTGQIMMDGSDASYAYIENADASMITFDQTEFWATGSLTATLVQAGTTTFQVTFCDESGAPLDTVDYTVTIQ